MTTRGEDSDLGRVGRACSEEDETGGEGGEKMAGGNPADMSCVTCISSSAVGFFCVDANPGQAAASALSQHPQHPS